MVESTVLNLKVCIVGAGMGGLTTALALAAAGFRDIEVFESASDLGFVGAGIQMAPNMARILDRLGVWQEISSEAVVLRETSIREGASDKELAHVDLRYIKKAFGYEHMVGHRSALARGLYNGCKQYPAVRFSFGMLIDDIVVGNDRPSFKATARKDPNQAAREITCDILLGADGIKSNTRVAMRQRLIPLNYQSITGVRLIWLEAWNLLVA